MISSYKLFESIVNEARTPEWMLERNSNVTSLSGERLNLDTINAIFNADPTRNKVYVNWILRLYGRTRHVQFMEDLYKVTECLEVYDRIKRNLPDNQRNIFNIPDLRSLEEVVSILDARPELALSKRQLNGDTPVEGEYEVLFENGVYSVIIPKTYRASCYWGSGTRWCTAYAGVQRYWDEYTAEGPLYIIYDRTINRPLYQFHFERGHFMDVDDVPINIDEFFSNNEDIKIAILEDVGKRQMAVTSITGLVNAISNGDISAIEMQIANGADRFILDYTHDSILNFAASKGYKVFLTLFNCLSDDIIRRIIHIKSTQKNENCLMLLAKSPDSLSHSIEEGISYNDVLRCINRAISLGLSLEDVDRSGNTVLIMAALNSDVALVKILIDLGVDLTRVKQDGMNLAHLISNKNSHLTDLDIEILDKILSAPNTIDLNAGDINGKTPLHYAVFRKDGQIAFRLIQTLIFYGADLNKEDNEGNTPMHAIAASFENSENLGYFISKGGDINKPRSSDGKTPIQIAKFIGNKKFIKNSKGV